MPRYRVEYSRHYPGRGQTPGQEMRLIAEKDTLDEAFAAMLTLKQTDWDSMTVTEVQEPQLPPQVLAMGWIHPRKR